MKKLNYYYDGEFIYDGEGNFEQRDSMQDKLIKELEEEITQTIAQRKKDNKFFWLLFALTIICHAGYLENIFLYLGVYWVFIYR